MSDLISRQAAINAIMEWGLIDGLAEGQAIEILTDEEKLPSFNCSEFPTGWIPCSERLPENGEYLITWTTSMRKRPAIGICECEVTGEYGHEKFEWLLEDYIKCYPDVEVTAWMPLPEPYKRREDKWQEERGE